MTLVLYQIILLFIFASQILGEVNSFYQLVDNWDDILHTINGFIMGAIGFSFLYYAETLVEEYEVKMVEALKKAMETI